MVPDIHSSRGLSICRTKKKASVLSPQLRCQPKTAVKNKSDELKKKGNNI